MPYLIKFRSLFYTGEIKKWGLQWSDDITLAAPFNEDESEEALQLIQMLCKREEEKHYYNLVWMDEPP